MAPTWVYNASELVIGTASRSSSVGERCKISAPFPEAVAIAEGRVAAGDVLKMSGTPDRRSPHSPVDAGETGHPGLVDAHTHLVFAGPEEELCEGCGRPSYEAIEERRRHSGHGGSHPVGECRSTCAHGLHLTDVCQRDDNDEAKSVCPRTRGRLLPRSFRPWTEGQRVSTLEPTASRRIYPCPDREAREREMIPAVGISSRLILRFRTALPVDQTEILYRPHRSTTFVSVHADEFRLLRANWLPNEGHFCRALHLFKR
jgi:hypothetical protein